MGNIILMVLGGIALVAVGGVIYYLVRSSRDATPPPATGKTTTAYTPGTVDGTETYRYIPPPKFDSGDKDRT